MSRIIFGFLCLILTGCATRSATPDSCRHPELFGNKKVPSREIYEQLDFTDTNGCLIDSMLLDDRGYERCINLTHDPRIIEVRCAPIYFGDGTISAEVNIVESGSMTSLKQNERRNSSSTNPLPDELIEIYTQHVSAWFDAVMAGKNLGEHVSENMLKYEEPALQAYVSKLATLSLKHKSTILENLLHAEDDESRTASAWLLPWAKMSQEDVAQTLEVIQDPSVSVRNNYSRFLYLFSDLLTSDALLSRALELFEFQLQLPSHADRNKALFAMLSLVQRDHRARKILNNIRSKAILEDIRSRSSLENVGGIAMQILNLLNSDEKDP